MINAGDGAHEHPTQALLDTFTIREKLGHIAGIHVAIIGDILFSRVARSNIHALLKLGAKVTLVGPSTLVPREFERLGVTVTHELDSVLAEVDVVNLLRIQHERQRKEYFPSLGEYTQFFGLTKERAERLKPGALIMHPGPINRGVEIDSDLADSSRSVILDQVTNGLAVRMAVLYLCAGTNPKPVMTIREHLNQKMRRPRMVRLPGFVGLLIVGYALAFWTESPGDVYVAVPFAAMIATLALSIFLAARICCPKCHQSIGQFLIPDDQSLIMWRPINHCPNCGIPLEADLEHL